MPSSCNHLCSHDFTASKHDFSSTHEYRIPDKKISSLGIRSQPPCFNFAASEIFSEIILSAKSKSDSVSGSGSGFHLLWMKQPTRFSVLISINCYNSGSILQNHNYSV
jgi:hypothetical protein